MHVGAGGAKQSLLTPWALLFIWGSLKEACIFWASCWKSFIPRIPTSSCHQLGVWTLHPSTQSNFVVLCWGPLQEIALLALLLHGSQPLQETLKVWPQLQQGPQIEISRCIPSYLFFFGCCSWVQESDPSMKTSQTLCRGPSLVAFLWWGPMTSLALPLYLLLGWSWLWEQWQMSGPSLVVDWLSLSICSSNMAAATRAH